MIDTTIGALSVKITSDTRGIKKGLKDTRKELKSTEADLESNSKQWDSWSAKSAAATAALSAVVVLTSAKIVQYSDSFTSITNKMKLATNGAEDLARTTEALFNISNDTRSSVESTVDLYTKMERATRKLDIGQSRLLKVTESINKAFSISGATTAEATGSIRQLGQALASGTLRGDEFNSIAEQAPIIMEAVREATGKTAGELRELAATGAITAEILIESLERYADKIDSDFSQSTATFAQKLEVAKNEAIKFVGANEAINDAVDAAGDGVLLLADNLDVLGKILTGLITIVGVKMVTALGLATAAQIRLTVAQTASVTTTSMIVAANGRAITSTINYTTAQRAAMLATNGLKGAMALLGGPAGVVALAVGSLISYMVTADDAKDPTQELSDKVKGLAATFEDLNRAQLDVGLATAVNNVQRLSSEIAGFKPTSTSDLFKLEELKKDLIEAKVLQQALFDAGTAFNLQGATDQSKETDDLQRGVKPLIDLGGAADDDKFAKDIAKQAAAGIKRLEIEKENTLSFLEELGVRFSSAEDLEIARNEKETKRLISTFKKGESITAEQHALLEGLQTQHATNMNRIRTEDGFLEGLRERFKTQNEIELEQFEIEKEMLDLKLASQLLTEAEHLALMAQLKATHEESVTEKIEEETKKRIEAAKRERVAKIQSAQGMANGLLALDAAFGSKSEKAQKKRRKVEVAINAAAGIMRAFAEQNFYVAIGVSALILANAKKQISNINSGSVSGSSGGTPSTAQPDSSAGGGDGGGAGNTRRVEVNFTGSGLMSDTQVRELIGQINDAQGDGAELNVTGG